MASIVTEENIVLFTKSLLCIACQKYDGPSVNEKVNSNLFSLPFIGEAKMNLNAFSLPVIGE